VLMISHYPVSPKPIAGVLETGGCTLSSKQREPHHRMITRIELMKQYLPVIIRYFAI
jgi:hypothetical protein